MNGLTNPFGTPINMFDEAKKAFNNKETFERLQEIKAEIDHMDIKNATRDRQIAMGIFYTEYLAFIGWAEGSKPEPEDES